MYRYSQHSASALLSPNVYLFDSHLAIDSFLVEPASLGPLEEWTMLNLLEKIAGFPGQVRVFLKPTAEAGGKKRAEPCTCKCFTHFFHPHTSEEYMLKGVNFAVTRVWWDKKVSWYGEAWRSLLHGGWHITVGPTGLTPLSACPSTTCPLHHQVQLTVGEDKNSSLSTLF